MPMQYNTICIAEVHYMVSIDCNISQYYTTLVITMTMAKMDLKPDRDTKDSGEEPAVPRTEVSCYSFSRSSR